MNPSILKSSNSSQKNMKLNNLNAAPIGAAFLLTMNALRDRMKVFSILRILYFACRSERAGFIFFYTKKDYGIMP